MNSSKKRYTPEAITNVTTDTNVFTDSNVVATDAAISTPVDNPSPDAFAPTLGNDSEPAPDEELSPKQGEAFDLAAIRLAPNYGADAPVKKALVTVPVRKPGRQDFYRVHPAETHRILVGLLIVEDTSETYLVMPDVADQLGADVKRRLLVLVINRQEVVSLWPLATAGDDGAFHDWGRSALKAAEIAKSQWVRLRSNRNLGAYEVEVAQARLPEPKWPDVSFSEIVNTAFRGRVIDTFDHPVIRKLKGDL